jgi:pSer/pThr/pTyr-binding forkhead associated (FHA) protein
MAYLAFNLNNGSEFVFDLREDWLKVGRDPSNDIVIDNDCISAFHAEFCRQPDGSYEIVDLDSEYGTFVREERITRHRLSGGEPVQFGRLESRYRLRNPARPPSSSWLERLLRLVLG